MGLKKIFKEMKKYIKALDEHFFSKKQQDEIFAKIKNCSIPIDIKSLPPDCHSCQYKYVGVDGRWCTFADLDLDTASVSKGERLKYCPLEIQIFLDGNVL